MSSWDGQSGKERSFGGQDINEIYMYIKDLLFLMILAVVALLDLRKQVLIGIPFPNV